MATKQILILPGDGIGPEIVTEARKVLEAADKKYNLGLSFDEDLMGGSSIDAHGVPLTDSALAKARAADAILLGAVGGPKWDKIDRAIRPEQGLLQMRSKLELFANLRPALMYPQLVDSSSLKPEVVSGLDILIVRELTGGIYFGQPRGIRTLDNGEREGYNTYVYSESEIERIGRIAFEMAQKRQGRVCSVDKANVLEATMLWREVMDRLAPEYPDVELSHMYVDNAAMQLVRARSEFEVLVKGHLFGVILSDVDAMIPGYIDMIPSASLNQHGQGMYEPCHGSAPDIAGQGRANPLATILSVAMMLRYSLHELTHATRIEKAVGTVLEQGLRTADIYSSGTTQVSTSAMGDAVVEALIS